MKLPVEGHPGAGTTAPKSTRVAAAAALRRWLSHATEPHILFPAIGVIALAAIWGATLNLVKIELAAAGHAAGVSGRELTETYEAQVLRAVREIDHALKVVKYAFEAGATQNIMRELKARALLPPDLLFTVSIADSTGNVVASTRPPVLSNVANQDYFQSQRRTDALSIGAPRQSTDLAEWKLEFSRRLNAADGSFAGIVVVSVDAAFFVSGYESSKLGEHGMLGIVGTDGIFRARRSGGTVSAGGMVDYATLMPLTDESETAARLSINAWDGVRRYTGAGRLYDFPLAVIVGLSEDEQLAAVRRNRRVYLWRALAGSVVLILIVVVLGRMSRQLALSRARAVEEHIAHAARVEYLAYHDGLTGLPNRSLFSKLLGRTIAQAHRSNRHLALLFLDLDHFKRVNDTLGHEAGDQLLQEVARRLESCLRDSDTVARLGGDEFVALLPDLAEETYAATVAQKILSAVSLPFVLQGADYRITASVGISIYPQDGLDEQTLAKNADTAMYQAKEEGKNKFRFYSDELNTSSLQRLTLESNLRRALEQNEFQLVYQPKRDIPSERISGMEVLLRWQHPDLGTVAPMQFIPLAEETGLIVPIGKWVIRTACLQAVAWQQQGLPRVVIAVNMSARQFADERLLADLAAILAETGMDARLLELEFSESLLMHDVGTTQRTFTGLRKLGVRIAIDDFGIGYSALATLRRFPLDTIKIDRSLICNVASVAENRALTEAIVAMGRSLSLTVVAQGVETKEQAEFLHKNACDQIQGFYFNKPLWADQIAVLLRTQADPVPSTAIPVA